MMNQSQRSLRGFTLLEILVALTVFAILATITSSAMYHAFNTRAHVTKQADRLNQLHITMALLQRDTQQIIGGVGSRRLPVFIGRAHYLEFTRGGNVNPDALEPQSSLMRVAFLCEHNQLIRRYWSTPNTPHRYQYQDKVLLDHVNQCQFAYLAKNRELLPQWQKKTLPPAMKNESLPTAIQFTVNLKDWGNMSLLFVVPEASLNEL